MTSMLSTRTSNLLLASVAVALLLFFLSFYADNGSPPTLSGQGRQAQHADFFLSNIHSMQYDDNGIIEMVLEAEGVEHNPLDNSSRMTEPRMTLHSDGAPAWNMSSQLGILRNNGAQIDLEQRVVIVSADATTTLRAPQLVVYPHRKIARTDKPVTLVNINGFTRSVGMRADFRSRNIELLEQVRGQYDATSK